MSLVLKIMLSRTIDKTSMTAVVCFSRRDILNVKRPGIETTKAKLIIIQCGRQLSSDPLLKDMEVVDKPCWRMICSKARNTPQKLEDK